MGVKRVSALTVFISLSVLLLSLSAEIRAEDINLQKVYPLYPQSEATTHILNPEFYRHSLFRDPKNDEHFLSKNIKIRLQNTSFQKIEELSTAETLAIRSELALLENLKFSSDLMVAMSPINDLGVDYFLQKNPFIENYTTRQDYFSLIPRSFADDTRPSLLFNLDYRPMKWAHFDLRFDRNWENRPVSSNDTNKHHGFFKMSLNPLLSTSLVMGAEIFDTNFINRDSLDRTNYVYFAQLNNKWEGLNTFIRYQTDEFHHQANSSKDYEATSLIVGVKKNWTRIDDAWIRLGITHKEAMVEEKKYFVGVGFKYSPTENIKFLSQNSYEISQTDRGEKELLKLSGGIHIKLPFDLQFRNFVRVNKTIDGETNYQFLTSIFRRFKS